MPRHRAARTAPQRPAPLERRVLAAVLFLLGVGAAGACGGDAGGGLAGAEGARPSSSPTGSGGGGAAVAGSGDEAAFPPAGATGSPPGATVSDSVAKAGIRPSSPLKETLAFEEELVELLGRSGEPDAGLVERMDAFSDEYPHYPFAHYLAAYVHHLRGDGEGERRLLSRAPSAVPYDLYFSGPPERVRLYLACNRLDHCLRLHFQMLVSPAPLYSGPAPAQCLRYEELLGGRPCPRDYAALERWSQPKLGTDRLWSWKEPGTTADDFAADLGVERGWRVADIGAGIGFFAVPLARRVGPSGRVYAVEVVEALYQHLLDRARAERLPQLRPVLGTEDDPALPEPVQLVLLCETLKDIRIESRGRRRPGEPLSYLLALRKDLLPGGRLVYCTEREGRGGQGRAELLAAGFRSEGPLPGYDGTEWVEIYRVGEGP